MEVDAGMNANMVQPQSQTRETQEAAYVQGNVAFIYCSCLTNLSLSGPPPPVLRDNFRDIQVKVHIRRPERDSWVYMGRGLVTQEVTGHSSRVGAFTLQIALDLPLELTLKISGSYCFHRKGHGCFQ